MRISARSRRSSSSASTKASRPPPPTAHDPRKSDHEVPTTLDSVSHRHSASVDLGCVAVLLLSPLALLTPEYTQQRNEDPTVFPKDSDDQGPVFWDGISIKVRGLDILEEDEQQDRVAMEAEVSSVPNRLLG